MIQGTIDRMEGSFAVTEFTPANGKAFMLDIHRDNLPQHAQEGDRICITMVNHIDLTQQNTCIYKDLNKSDILQRHLAPLSQPVACSIDIDRKETAQRSAEMKQRIASLWS